MRFLLMLLITLWTVDSATAQKKVVNYSDPEITKMINTYKKDIRGPYKDIRWFCIDGTTVAPQERCPELGGVQRARYRDEVVNLAEANHVYLGQILSKTAIDDFWDQPHEQSRAKQYQLEQFLRANDNGWINRRAQFYRGAFQIEDEENWGIGYFYWVLEEGQRAADQFFYIRQSAKDIPHASENNVALNVRAVSKEISDSLSTFMDLRVKLHGQPESGDQQKVKSFYAANKGRIKPEINEKFIKLIADLETLYKPIDINDFKSYQRKLPNGSIASKTIGDFIINYGKTTNTSKRCELIAQASLTLRQEISNPMKASARLALIDASNKMEVLLNRESVVWKPKTLKEQMLKIKTLCEAATGFGYIQLWEWEVLENDLVKPDQQDISIKELNEYVDNTRRIVEWGIGMVRATYQDVVKLYAGFEPLANSFIDDKVRGSVLLPLGSSVSKLGDFFSAQAGFSNYLIGTDNQSAARGLNPGYALGELVVTTQVPEEIEVDKNKIYIFNRPPADLKPVAGIATVTEGNMVSHVQLLARNLGIPNAVVSMENLTALLPFNGKKVFYAVSNKGSVILKPEEEMTDAERALFTKQARSEEKISVPIEQMQLSDPKLLNLRDVNATLSGKACGPKAANLGQLKQMYPELVVEGLVIPFSIFRAHFDQQMPDQGMSYWQFLSGTFKTAETMRTAGSSDDEIEVFVLDELDNLQKAIKQMSLLPDFEEQLKSGFKEVFGLEMGEIPVFIRSDTNMEDLKDFTGAGLNLTLFNVLDANLIMQGIKDVWASPYTERSYKWRQKYLLNPENVFPSILIIPSVNAECSGVMITKGVTNGSTEDQTVAFNRGVGGAVEGQSSETWLLKSNGQNLLLSPAREPQYMSIPATGGTVKVHTEFNAPVLSEAKLLALREMAEALNKDLPLVGVKGPYDVELGFKDDKIWLFQVRPFVENKRAASSDYLRSITPELNESLVISLDTAL